MHVEFFCGRTSLFHLIQVRAVFGRVMDDFHEGIVAFKRKKSSRNLYTKVVGIGFSDHIGPHYFSVRSILTMPPLDATMCHEQQAPKNSCGNFFQPNS